MSLFHPDTQILIDRLHEASPQSLLISGHEGVGLLAVARAIAEGSELTIVSPDESKASRPITTEAIRQLYDATRSKSIKRQSVVVSEADRMTRGAQAAFLKLLEEPNTSVYFILTSSRPDVLLPTIRSRVQQSVISPITLKQSEDYLSERGVADAGLRRQLLYLAEGLPEELIRLISDKAYFDETVQRMQDARELLQSPLYEKLLTINSYKDNRGRAQQLLAAAIHMTRRSLSGHPQKAAITQLDKLLVASEQLEANANVRLSLTQLVI